MAEDYGASPETEVVSSQAPRRLTEKAAAIYERSVVEARAVPDWIEDHDGTMWIPIEPRSKAIAFYAGELGIPFTKVRAHRDHMRVDLNAIADLAEDMVECGDYDDDGQHVAYTWDGEGWVWEKCEKGAERAAAFWRCEEAAACTRPTAVESSAPDPARSAINQEGLAGRVAGEEGGA